MLSKEIKILHTQFCCASCMIAHAKATAYVYLPTSFQNPLCFSLTFLEGEREGTLGSRLSLIRMKMRN